MCSFSPLDDLLEIVRVWTIHGATSSIFSELAVERVVLRAVVLD